MYFHHFSLDIDLTDNYKKIIDDIIVHDIPIDITYKSTQYGIQYELFREKYFEQLNPITSKIKEKIYSELRVKNLKLCSAWTVLGKRGTYHTCHRHNTNTDISSVLYLESPDSNFPSGAFYFFADEKVYDFQPKKGDLIIFPVTMFHGSYPQGDGLRQTLNMDFSQNP